MSMRSTLAGELSAQLPAWKVIPHERDLDRVDIPTVVIRFQQLRWDATLGRLVAVFKLTVLTAHLDVLENAEDDLDDRVEELLAVLLGLDGIRVESGTKTRYGTKGFPSWELNCETPIIRKV